jgi:hypothetical protein
MLFAVGMVEIANLAMPEDERGERTSPRRISVMDLPGALSMMMSRPGSMSRGRGNVAT